MSFSIQSAARIGMGICMAIFAISHAAFTFAADPPADKDQAEKPAVEKPAEADALPARAEPLWQQDPYDEIVLDEANNKAVLKVLPLELAGRKLPVNPRPTDEIELHLLDRPEQTYKLAWQSIEQVTLFEKRLLDKAEQLVAVGLLDEAFGYFKFLEDRYPKLDGLEDAAQRFLWAQASQAVKAGRNEEALAMLLKLHERNPGRKGLAAALERVYVRLIGAHVKSGGYASARGLLRNLAAALPEASAAVVEKWQSQLSAEAAVRQAEARVHLQAGRLREAQRAAEQMLDAWPQLAGARQLARAIYEKYPRVTVAVTSPYLESARDPLAWAAVRDRRLLGRPLIEPSPDSAKTRYRSIFGKVEVSDDRRRLSLDFKENLLWPGGARPLTSYDAARQLLQQDLSEGHVSGQSLAGRVSSIETPARTRLVVNFSTPQLCPEGSLACAISKPSGPSRGPSEPGDAVGPYWLESREKDEVRFVARPGYFAARPGQLSEIVERTFADASAALQALSRGQVGVIDRLNPWDVRSAANRKEFVVEPYGLPTVQCLLVNPHRPLLNNRMLRRALVYGIDRAGILKQVLWAGHVAEGSQVLPGPLPRSFVKDDPYAAAFDPKLEPLPYDPGLALVYTRMALDERKLDLKPGDRDPAELVLAHPPHAVARAACRSIAEQLNLVGLRVELRQTPSGEPPSDDYDLLFVEYAVPEVTIDVWRVLGPGGLAGDCSGPMHEALRALDKSATAAQACERLRDVQRLAHAELNLLPLWQITEHLAYRANLQGVGRHPRSLFQNVENWRAELRGESP